MDLDAAGRSYALIADDKNQCQISKSSAASSDQEPLQEDGPPGHGPDKGGQKFMNSDNKFGMRGLNQRGQDFNKKHDFMNPDPVELAVAVFVFF